MLIFLFLFNQIFCSKLHVLHPQSLKDQFQDGIDYNEGNIGHIPYGKQFVGACKLANPINGCEAIESQSDSSILTFYVIKRGDCPFVTKVNNAQIHGGSVVIIIDNVYERDQDIIMMDDGFAYKLKIPTIIITKKDGEKLIEAINNAATDPSQQVEFQIDFEIKQRKQVDLIFWINLLDRDSFIMLRDYQEFEHKLKHINIQANYFMWNGQNYQTSSQNRFCLDNGKYCMNQNLKLTDLSTEFKDSFQFEVLRQKCILTHFQDKYIQYMSNFDSHCFNQKGLHDCAKMVMELSVISYDKIKQCVQESYGLDQEITQSDVKTINNKILDQNIRSINKHQIHYWPSLSINDQEYRGNLDIEGILDAICNAYSQKQTAEICNEYVEKIHIRTHWTIIIAVIAVCLSIFIGLGFFVYRRYIKIQMNQDMEVQVNKMVTQYIAFYESRNNTLDNTRA